MNAQQPPHRPTPSYMSIVTWIVIIGAVVAFFLVKRLTQASPVAAQDWLRKGALVIDVRSESEYQERHLRNAVNIPLNRLGDEIGRYATNKEQPILLHCLSGARSGMGANTLKRMGYINVSNLGSYGRAEKIISEAAGSEK
jgi:phage shock protein E